MAKPLWIDYSGGTVSGATMAANGIEGAIRYGPLGNASKQLTRAEYQDHLDHGRQTAIVVEKTTTDADAGAAGGKANAEDTLGWLETLTKGLPPITMVLMANDKPTFVQADVDYVGAAAQVFAGGALVGPYGFGSYLAACAKAGVAPVGWQAGPAPSRTGTAAIATWWQRNGGPTAASDGPALPVTITLDGVSCDLSNRLLEVPSMTTPADIWNYSVAIPPAVQRPGDPSQVPAWMLLLYGNRAAWDDNDALKALAASLSGVDADVKASASSVLAAIANGVTAQLTAAQVAEIEAQLAKALPGYTVNITPQVPTQPAGQ